MKVLYFHQHFNTPSGAGGLRSYKMARALIAAGHEITMVCGSLAGSRSGLSGAFSGGMRRGEVDGIRVIEFDLPYSNSDNSFNRVRRFLSFAFRSMRIAVGERADLVFATSTPLTVALPGILSRFLRRRPFVFEVRDLWPELPKAMGVIRNPLVLLALTVLEWVSYRSADRHIALSTGMAEGMIRRGVSRSTIAVIPNGCDLDLFNESVVPWRPDGLSQDKFVAIYAGTHGRANGLINVLFAAETLKLRGRSDIKFLLVGDGQMKPLLVAEAEKRQLDSVTFIPPVPKNMLPGLIRSCDIGLQVLENIPAFSEGTSPNKFFDYLAAGLPVLCNYPGWSTKLLEDRMCGFAVSPDDPEAFADALEAAADNRGSLRQMGQSARRLAEEEFDRDKLAEQFVAWVVGGPAAILNSRVTH